MCQAPAGSCLTCENESCVLCGRPDSIVDFRYEIENEDEDEWDEDFLTCWLNANKLCDNCGMCRD